MKCVLVVVLLASFLFAVEPGPVPHTWKISNLQSPVYTGAAHPWLTVSPDRVIFADKKHKPLLEIPATQIERVIYTPISFSRAYQVAGDKSRNNGLWAPLSSGCAGSEVGCGGMAMLYTMALIIGAPMHGRSHFLRITWKDRNVEQQLQFEASKDDYLAMVESFKAITGVKYTDLGAEANRVQTELSQNADKAFTVKLEQASKLGDYNLVAGIYTLVPLDRGQGKADVFFFSAETAPKIDPSKVKAAARATVSDSSRSDAVEYVKGGGHIAAIQAEGKLFRFAAE